MLNLTDNFQDMGMGVDMDNDMEMETDMDLDADTGNVGHVWKQTRLSIESVQILQVKHSRFSVKMSLEYCLVGNVVIFN